MTFKIGNKYGKLSKRGKGKYTINAKLKQDIQVIVDELLSSIKIQELSRYERLQYTKVLLPYIAPKMREYDVKNDLIDVPVIESKNEK
jgi:hypothetical protein